MSIKVTLHAPKGRLTRVILSPHPHFEQEWVGSPIPWVANWLAAYQKGEEHPISIDELNFATPFSRKVNLALLTIPFGNTLTYGELGQKIGCKSGQAIGQALHHNPYPLLLPCHRILPKKGGIGGYAFCSSLKANLLSFEHGKIS